MGYNSTVVVLNDALHIIGEDKEFGRKIEETVLRLSVDRKGIDISSGNHANVARVIETHHADEMHLISVGGNLGTDLGYVGNWRFSEEDMLRAWAQKLGFDIRKKATR